MTDLAVPSWMQRRRAQDAEHWHAQVMRGGLIAGVVVARSEGSWTARTQLRDRSLRPVGECVESGPFATEDAALRAGQAAGWRLHKAIVGMREVAEPVVAMSPPPGGFQSQALRRFARIQRAMQAKSAASIVPESAPQAGMIA